MNDAPQPELPFGLSPRPTNEKQTAPKKKRPPKATKRSVSPKRAKPQNGKPWWKSLPVKIFGWAIVLFGAIGTAVSLQDKISVFPAEPLSATMATRGPFILRNDGPLTIHDVHARPIVNWIEGAGLFFGGNVDANLDTKLEKVWPNATFPIETYSRAFPAQSATRAGELDITVSYRPNFFWPWRKTQRFMFTARKTDDGRMLWYPARRQPLAQSEAERLWRSRSGTAGPKR